MECLHAWGWERGLPLTLTGWSSIRSWRMHAWADRIHTGNVSEWAPPRRFTYVRTGLEYVAPGSEAGLIARLLRDVVEPDGRLLVGPVYGAAVETVRRAFADAGIPHPGAVSAADRNGETRYVLWAGAPPERGTLSPASAARR
jgi:hypothetical protein